MKRQVLSVRAGKILLLDRLGIKEKDVLTLKENVYEALSNVFELEKNSFRCEITQLDNGEYQLTISAKTLKVF